MAEAGDVVIGFPQEQELDSMLHLMCASFGIPYEPTRDIFRNDPYFNIENKRVLRVGSKIVSCLTIVESICWIGSASVPIAGVANVATLEAYREMGFAKLLLTDTMETLKKRCYSIAGIFALNREYYRRLGWESVSFGYNLQIPRTALLSSALSSRLRPAEIKDIPALIELYNGVSEAKSLRLHRDEKRWRYLLQHVPDTLIFQNNGSKPQGYLMYQSVPGTIDLISPPKSTPPSLHVLELATNSDEALSGIKAYLCEQIFAESITCFAPIAELQHNFGIELLSAYPPAQKSGVMLKILDFEKLINLLSVNWRGLNGHLSLGIKFAGEGSYEVMDVVILDAVTNITRAEEPITAVLCGDKRYWAQVITGFMSAELAIAGGLLKWSSPPSENECSLVTKMFPARDPFVPNADQF